jgi:hypothetical protein
LQREKGDNIFAKVDEASLEADSLLEYRIVNKGLECKKYGVDDLVLVSADKVKKIKYPQCPEDIFIIYNEDLIFGKILKA